MSQSGTISESTSSSGSMVFLNSTTEAVFVPAIEITSDINATYSRYVIVLHEVVCESTNINIDAEVSTDSGGTWKTGGTDYGFTYVSVDSVTNTDSSDGINQMTFIFDINSVDITPVYGHIYMLNPADAATKTMFYGQAVGFDASPVIATYSGMYNSNTAVNGFRILASGSTIKGTLRLYGVNES